MRGLQLGAQALVFALVKADVGMFQRVVLAGSFSGNEVGNVGQTRPFVQLPQVRVDYAGAHQVNAREQHAIDVEQRPHAPRSFLVEELPLRLRKAKVVMRVVLRDHSGSRRRKETLTYSGIRMSLVTSTTTWTETRPANLL